MTYLVSKRIKGHDYWYEVESRRKGKQVHQVFRKYIGRDGRPSNSSLRNLGKQELEVIRRDDPEWAAAWDAPDGHLIIGRKVWKRLVLKGELTERERKAVTRWERLLRKQLGKHDPLEVQEAENQLLREAEAEGERRVDLIVGLRRAGKLEKWDRLQLARMEASMKHFSDNLESGMKPVAALRAARVQTADERQAIKDMENSLPGPGK